MAQELSNITSLETLRLYAQGDIIELPAFSEGQPFVARLRRPSLMALVKSGKIPNSLLRKANELFSSGIGGAFDEENQEVLSEMFDILDIICEASFMEPTYAEIKAVGLTLTDEQKMFVYNYSQAGVKALESFRSEQTDTEISGGDTSL